jgi:TolB-like protein
VQIADGLAAAHARGIVHRDLKPENVFVTTDGRVKILDFGLAKTVHISDPDAATLTGVGIVTGAHVVLGTPGYMAPEQVRGEPLDQRADIFAFGCVLYELLGGRPAFSGATTLDVLSAILRDTPAPLVSSKDRPLPPQLARAVEHCLEKEPAARFESARDLAFALRSITGATAGILNEEPSRGRMRGWVIGAGIVTALAMLAFASAGLWRGPAGAPIRSLAVLPLENLAGDPEQEYFVAGMQEALGSELSRISALTIRSQTSAMRYRQTGKLLPQIARELQVDAVIEGSVQRDGDHVRITVRLIHGASDRRLWTGSFDRDLRGILQLQSEVATAVAEHVRAALTPQERTWLASSRHVHPEAYQAYLKGVYELAKSPIGIESAFMHFRQAIDLDPAYAPAYYGLADSYNRWAIQGHRPAGDVYPLAKAALLQALDLDPLSSDVHAMLGVVKLRFDWDWQGAERSLNRALELQPNSARAHLAYASYRLAMSDVEKFLSHSARERDLDPLSPAASIRLAWGLFEAGRHEQAIVEAQNALALEPDSADAHTILALSHAAAARHSDASRACDQARRLRADDPNVLERCGQVASLGGRHQDAQHAWNTLVGLSAVRHVDPFLVAGLAAVIDRHQADQSRVFEWLERAHHLRSPRLIQLTTDRRFENVRQDPRFQDLIRRMHFPG